MKCYKYIFPAILLFVSVLVFAQTDSSRLKGRPEFKAGIYYTSRLNYYGRTDSLRSNAVFPLVELWLNKNFYLNAAPVFVSNKLELFQYAATIATAGYQFRDENKLAGHFYIVKPFYRDNSGLVQSALKWQVAANLTFLNDFVNLTTGADLKFSDKTDIGATGGLDHVFRLQLNNHSVLVADPSFYVYAGTQQFTKSYISKSGGFLLFPGNENLLTESTRRFNILSYELSVPFILGLNKFQFILTPAYVLPQNLVTVTNNPDGSENGKKMFYLTAGAKIIL